MFAAKGEQMNQRFMYIDRLVDGCEQLISSSSTDKWSIVQQFAQERILHLAIETITDIGSLLIDCFELREASSYLDIVEIMRMEDIIDHSLSENMKQLVQLRKSLIQEYTKDSIPDDQGHSRFQVHPFIHHLPSWLLTYKQCIHAFIEKENIRWGYPRLGTSFQASS